jgi:D-hydroxyproline dehydrogenase subunit gamma
MFRRLDSAQGSTIELTIDGQPARASTGDSVAAALLANRASACRTTPVTGSLRGPFCMMGVCFDCLVTIDGLANQQACLIPLRAGMAIERQRGARALRENIKECEGAD